MISVLQTFLIVVNDLPQVFNLLLFSMLDNIFNCEGILSVDSFLEIFYLVLHVELGLELSHPFLEFLFEFNCLFFDFALDVIIITLVRDDFLALAKIFLFQTNYK